MLRLSGDAAADEVLDFSGESEIRGAELPHRCFEVEQTRYVSVSEHA